MIWSPVGYLVQVCFTFLIHGLQRIYVRVGKAEERILVLGWKAIGSCAEGRRGSRARCEAFTRGVAIYCILLPQKLPH